MSTWYYLVCEQHKVHSGILAGRSFPARWWMQEDREGLLAAFIEAHHDCKPVLVSEDDDRTWDDIGTGFTEFPPEEKGQSDGEREELMRELTRETERLGLYEWQDDQPEKKGDTDG